MHRSLRLVGLALASFAPLSISAVACGTRSELNGPESKDGGKDAHSDAPIDAKPDVKDGGVDASPDAPAIKPGLGLGCDGTGTNPTGCQSGLQCYTGDDQQDDPERWPGGYCTHFCSDDSDCKAYGGVCGGGFSGSGHCLLDCELPSQCRQGYACRSTGFSAGKLACAPTGFIATRGPGEACFQHDDQAKAHYLAPLPITHFSASQKIDPGQHFTENEIAVAVNSTGAIVAGANAIEGGGYANPAWFGSTSVTPITFKQSSGPTNASANFYSDPYLVTSKNGTFFYSALGLDFSLNATLLVASSSDQGSTWKTIKANPDSDCSSALPGEQGPCMDHPWLAIGPDKLNPTQEALYTAYLSTRDNDYPTVLIRSTDGGQTWGIPGAPGQSLVAFSPNIDFFFTNLITPTVDDEGVVHMVASAVGEEPKGSVFNSIQYTRSEDGGKTRTPPVRVNPVDEAVPYEQAVIATDQKTIFVVYVAGSTDGAWDVMLAKSTDNAATFSYEKVNDEPEPCATHFHPTLAIDKSTHKVYVGWYDGRFAPYEGSVAMAVCDPSLTGKQCGPNEAIGDAPFFITTDRFDFTFIGDYFQFALTPGGKLWAGFGDTRENDVSHGYVALGQF